MTIQKTKTKSIPETKAKKTRNHKQVASGMIPVWKEYLTPGKEKYREKFLMRVYCLIVLNNLIVLREKKFVHQPSL